MKKFLTIISTLLLVTIAVSAQSTTPRFGITAGQDNTGRVLNYRWYNPTDAAGADTVNLAPRAYSTVIKYSAVDSLAFDVTSTASCYAGDHLRFMVTNSSGSGHLVKFIGSNWQLSSSGNITLTASKRATIDFIFDGTYWVETGRMVQ